MKISYKNDSVGSVLKLARMLDVSVDILKDISTHPEKFYKVSEIAKKSGGVRIISDPNKDLKIIQRRIVTRIFRNCSFPDYLFGSIKDENNPRDFVRNAEYHKNATEVMAFDVADFFPSVQPRFVKRIFKYALHMPADVAEILTLLTTLNEGLPQGAPTSSYLANLLFYDIEHKVFRTLSSKGLVYSRLVDDITVSSTLPITREMRGFVYTQILGMLAQKKLSVKKDKYKVTNTGKSGLKTVVTGLVVEDGKVKLPKERIKALSKNIYEIGNRAATERTENSYHTAYGKASGLTALYSRLSPEKAGAYRNILQRVKPIYSREKVRKIAYLCRRFVAYAKVHPEKKNEEGFARKYFKYKHKLGIMRRTNRDIAKRLEQEMKPLRPSVLMRSYRE